jgi:hypothetical protein
MANYRFENHDWDMTLHAARRLAEMGRDAAGDRSAAFSCSTGAMLLSFCAVESFANSVAFARFGGERGDSRYRAYLRARGLKAKLAVVCKNLEIPLDWGIEPWTTIDKMRTWRNALVHTSPYVIESDTELSNSEARRRESELGFYNYPIEVTANRGVEFFNAAHSFIEKIESALGIASS